MWLLLLHVVPRDLSQVVRLGSSIFTAGIKKNILEYFQIHRGIVMTTGTVSATLYQSVHYQPLLFTWSSCNRQVAIVK